MNINLNLILIMGFICYFVLPLFILLFVRNNKLAKILTIILLSIFVIVLFIGVTCNFVVKNHNIYIAFDFTHYGLQKNIIWKFKKNMKFDYILNLIMLIPIGLTIVFFNYRKTIKTCLMLVLIGFAIGISIESMQYFLPIQRSVQLSDVILNAFSTICGGVIGYLYLLIYKVIYKRLPFNN